MSSYDWLKKNFSDIYAQNKWHILYVPNLLISFKINSVSVFLKITGTHERPTYAQNFSSNDCVFISTHFNGIGMITKELLLTFKINLAGLNTTSTKCS